LSQQVKHYPTHSGSKQEPKFEDDENSKPTGQIDAMGRTMCYNTHIFLKEG